MSPAFDLTVAQVDTLPLPGLPILGGAAQTPLSPQPLLLPQAGGQDEASVSEAAVEQAPTPGTLAIAQTPPRPPATSAIAALAEQLLAHTVLVSVADRDEALAGRIAAVSGELLVLVPPADEEVIYVRLECVTALRTVFEGRERDDDDGDDAGRRGSREWDEEADAVQDWDADEEEDAEADVHEEDGGDRSNRLPARTASTQIRAIVPMPVQRPPALERQLPAQPDTPIAVAPTAARPETATAWPEPPPAAFRPWRPINTRATVQLGPPVACIIGPEGYKLISVYRPGQVS